MQVTHTAEHTRAYIKVQDGCNQFCSYCIIPYARGRVRSRNLEHVLEEVRTLAASGYKEVVLTGIHLSSYGIDTGESLLELIQKVHEIDGIKRIRLGSLEPRIITERICFQYCGTSEDVSTFSSVITEWLQCDPEAYESSLQCRRIYGKTVIFYGNISTIRH